MSNSKTLADLSEESGIPARTIRFYISRGLLEGPMKAGRGAVYTAAHLARLKKIQQLQAKGHMLAEIAHEIDNRPQQQGSAEEAAVPLPPTPCWQYAIAEDVTILVRGDVSPWRMKQIRAALNDLASRLRQPEAD